MSGRVTRDLVEISNRGPDRVAHKEIKGKKSGAEWWAAEGEAEKGTGEECGRGFGYG